MTTAFCSWTPTSGDFHGHPIVSPGAPDGKQETGAAERKQEKPDAFIRELKKPGLEIFESKVTTL
jgi:hypothetical protein